MKKKWYLQTWFIALLFFFTFFGIVMSPPVGLAMFAIGIALIVLQAKESKKVQSAYGAYDEVIAKTNSLEEEFSNKQQTLEKEFAIKRESLEEEFEIKHETLEEEFSDKETSLNAHYKEVQDAFSNEEKNVISK